ncbi:MAG: hypothetical protein AB8B55_12870 [Mariniblastus sp.]
MTEKLRTPFDEISKNNLSVDESIDRFVEHACTEVTPNEVLSHELKKTSRLLFLSCLIQNSAEGSVPTNSDT